MEVTARCITTYATTPSTSRSATTREPVFVTASGFKGLPWKWRLNLAPGPDPETVAVIKKRTAFEKKKTYKNCKIKTLQRSATVKFLYFSTPPPPPQLPHYVFPGSLSFECPAKSNITDCKFLTKFTSLTPSTSLFICPHLPFVCSPIPLSLSSSCSLSSLLADRLSWTHADVAPAPPPRGLSPDHHLQ